MRKGLGFVRKKRKEKKRDDLGLDVPDGVRSDISGKHAAQIHHQLVLEQKPNWTDLGESLSRQGRWERNNEPIKNKLVISVNNARFFHIGSRKSINIGRAPSMQKCEIPPPCHGLLHPKTHSSFLDREKSLREADIALISQNASDNWKDFLKSLGLEETFLEVLESRSNNNKTLAVYDGLQKYKTMFPNTSIAFVIHVLIQVEQPAIVDKLTSGLQLN